VSNLGNRGLGQRYDQVSYVSQASTTLSTKQKMADLELQLEEERQKREKAEVEIK
jgi:cell division protein FtsL